MQILLTKETRVLCILLPMLGKATLFGCYSMEEVKSIAAIVVEALHFIGISFFFFLLRSYLQGCKFREEGECGRSVGERRRC